ANYLDTYRYGHIPRLVSGASSENECKRLYGGRLFRRMEDGYVVFIHTADCRTGSLCSGRNKF
ncbi:hypothetical protein DMB84_005905, partial [Pectobacterium aquaticum]